MPRAKKIEFPVFSGKAPTAFEPAAEDRVAETGEAPHPDDTPDPFATPEPSVATKHRDDLFAGIGAVSLPRLTPALKKSLVGIARVAGITAGTALVSFLAVNSVAPALMSGNAPEVAASASATPAMNRPLVGPAAAVASAAPTPPGKQRGSAASGLPDAKIEELATPPGFALEADRGLLEVATPDREAIHIDGEWMGRGPLRRYPIESGKHQVEIKTEGQSRTYDVAVTAGRRTRLSLVRPE
jgi:hypothetical protein